MKTENQHDKIAINNHMITEVSCINGIFEDHGIDANIMHSHMQPTPSFLSYKVTRQNGLEIKKVTRLQPELSDALTQLRGEKIHVRFEELPLSIEVPHPFPKPLTLNRDQFSYSIFPKHAMLLGRSYVDGKAKDEIAHFDVSPHYLGAAITGGGKSVLNVGMLLSLCDHTPPDELRLHLIDPKNDDLLPLKHLPHTESYAGDIKAAEKIVKNLYNLMQARKVSKETVPRHVILVEEMADINDSDIIPVLLKKIGAQGRSIRINMIGATQYPSVEAVGSLIRSQFPCRLIGQVFDKSSSTIACGRGGVGAEFLPGKGSFLRLEGGQVVRFQSYYYAPEAVLDYVAHIRSKYLRDGQAASLSLATMKAELINEQPRWLPVEEIAQKASVQRIFEKYYDSVLYKEKERLKYGGLSKVIAAIYGKHTPTGGGYRVKALQVVDYLVLLRQRQ